MFLEVRLEQIFRDWTTFIRNFFFKDTSGRALISSADGVRMEVGSTKLEQVFTQLVLYCLFILLFPALVVGVWISSANLFESGYLFFEAQRLFSMAVLNFNSLCVFRCCPIPTSCRQ